MILTIVTVASPGPMSVAECHQDGNVECKKCHVEVAIVEYLFRQKPPIHSPLEQKLTTEFKRLMDVGDGIDKQKR